MQFELLDFLDADPEVVTAWRRLLDQHEHPSLIYSSPEWAAHSRAHGRQIGLVVARDAARSVVGVVPVLNHRVQLGLSLDVVDVIGSVPLVSAGADGLGVLIDFLLQAYPAAQAVYFDALPGDNPCWTLPGTPIRYSWSGAEPCHWIELSGSFESYLSGLRPKSRYNVERALRKFRSASSDKLELVQCRTPDQVDAFHGDAAEIWRRCQQSAHFADLEQHPQTRREALADLARRGLLKSYVLRSGSTPVAFVIGYQYRDIYFYVATGYDRRFARHSPGTVLLYLLLEDLFGSDTPRRLSFGKGDQEYKRRFGTSEQSAGSCLMLRATLGNAARARALQAISRVQKLLPIRRAP